MRCPAAFADQQRPEPFHSGPFQALRGKVARSRLSEILAERRRRLWRMRTRCWPKELRTAQAKYACAEAYMIPSERCRCISWPYKGTSRAYNSEIAEQPIMFKSTKIV